MPLNLTRRGGHIHIIGIGGAGMSAIARILLDSGVQVSGSDRQANAITQQLAADGAIFYQGHAAAHITNHVPEAVLISSAIHEDNPEVIAARAAGIPVLKRREAFPLLLPEKELIAVAGTHGKTTTTAMVAHLLREVGADPSYIVGGVMLNTGDNAHAGAGRAFVVEADEYDYMFLGLSPRIAIVTNVEHDHPDMFPTLESTLEAFRQFIQRLPDDGLLITCADDEHALALGMERRKLGKPVLFYALEQPHAEWLASIDDSADTLHTYFGVRYHDRGVRVYEQAAMQLSGRHSVLNALAALAATYAHGIALDKSVAALASFQGTARRFQHMGRTAQGVDIFSDYGHHPTAIKATLQATRARYPQAKIWAVWQPHTFSRTKLLLNQFAHAFTDANHALVTDIYASREQYQAGDPDGEYVAAALWDAGHADARHSGTLADTAALLRQEAKDGDVVVIFSAGDGPHIGEILLEK